MIDRQEFEQLADGWDAHCKVINLMGLSSDVTNLPEGKRILDEIASLGEEILPFLAARYRQREEEIIDSGIQLLPIVARIKSNFAIPREINSQDDKMYRHIIEWIDKNYLTWVDAT